MDTQVSLLLFNNGPRNSKAQSGASHLRIFFFQTRVLVKNRCLRTLGDAGTMVTNGNQQRCFGTSLDTNLDRRPRRGILDRIIKDILQRLFGLCHINKDFTSITRAADLPPYEI